jgi:dolichol-phosphate mannosyltransferase
LATYNERETLPSLVDAVFDVLPESHILVVDDNSPDGTGQWCDERAADDPPLRCLHRAGKLGLGTATIAAMRTAIDDNYDVLVTMDADWSHDPCHLPELIAATDEADIAIGSRYCPGGQIDGWPLVRRVVSRITNTASRRLMRLPVRDASSAYRAYRVARLREISLDAIRATGYAYLEEIVWHLDRSGATFAERPITFRDRRGGRSKASAQEAIGKITTIGRLMFR